MKPSITDTIVEFDIKDFNMNIFDWLVDMSPDTWCYETIPSGRTIGISFKNENDAIIFKLKFGL